MVIRIVITAIAFVLAVIATRRALAFARVTPTRYDDEPDDVAAVVGPSTTRSGLEHGSLTYAAPE